MIYNRIKVLDYARRYAITPNKEYPFFETYSNHIGGDCTNFLSQCLIAGGAQMTYSPNPWYLRKLDYLPYYEFTTSWSLAHSLYWFLRGNWENNYLGPKGIKLELLSHLEIGDLIFFEKPNRKIFHGAVITSFSKNNEPLISQHSHNCLDIPIKPEYLAGTIHFLKIIL